MDESKSDTKSSDPQAFKHITLKSSKYNIQYELVWSEKFIKSISNLTNIAFTNIIKKLKGDAEDKMKDIVFGNKWLLTNKLHKSFQESELRQKSNDSHENLIKEIEASLLPTGFGNKLLLDSND